MLRAHSSLTGCKKGAGRREGHKFVTGVEVRPSKHRRQLQPLRCVCGAPGPTHRICAYISRAALLHASHTQAIHPCTPLAPPRIILTASHLRRARTSPSRREGCGVCQFSLIGSPLRM